MIVVVDFGSQYNQLIARRVRSHGVPARILPYSAKAAEIRALAPSGIILSGGPASVHAKDSPQLDPEILALGVPVLGICYGMQAIAHASSPGSVSGAGDGEYGRAALAVSDDPLFAGLPSDTTVWMSHRDAVRELPANWRAIASTPGCACAAMRHESNPWWGVQFHPEVHHTEHGERILANFVERICAAHKTWNLGDWIERHVESLRAEVGARNVVAAVSGGVDSTVMAALLHRALGERLRCIFIDNGLVRTGETEQAVAIFKSVGISLEVVDASAKFLSALANVEDPEEKRRIIGRIFIEVLAPLIGSHDLLAQGTLYPDVIESVSTHGPSARIKTHHNRVDEVLGLIKEGRIVEPLRELFKDEVREVGRRLGVPHEAIVRHPFPGPGLAVRIIGPVSADRLALLRAADLIFVEELKRADLYDTKTWQAFAVLLPVRTVGVMGDERTFGNVVALRAVTATDGMTADWARLPHDVLARVSTRIVNEVRGITRVVFDITSKPPSTIEWE